MTEFITSTTPWNRWTACVVAAPGPSLTEDVARQLEGEARIVAVGDAWRRLPWAAILYHCDAKWWRHHRGCPGFAGNKWSSHETLDPATRRGVDNDKAAEQRDYGLSLIRGRDEAGFSLDPGVIHYGGNSGFQAINLAILQGARRIVLVGFDMRGTTHFFGEHPPGVKSGDGDYRRFLGSFREAARLLPAEIEIVNCTPDSALDCFGSMPLEAGLAWLAQTRSAAA